MKALWSPPRYDGPWLVFYDSDLGVPPTVCATWRDVEAAEDRAREATDGNVDPVIVSMTQAKAVALGLQRLTTFGFASEQWAKALMLDASL